MPTVSDVLGIIIDILDSLIKLKLFILIRYLVHLTFSQRGGLLFSRLKIS